MKRLIAEVLKRPDGSFNSVFRCVGRNDLPDQAIASTLLEFLELSHPSAAEIERLVVLAEVGGYEPKNPAWADWGVNDVDLWLLPPMAKPGHICIANENIPEYSTEDGQPQQFTYQQFHAALKHWREFRALLAREGKDRLVGQRYEVQFPD